MTQEPIKPTIKQNLSALPLPQSTAPRQPVAPVPAAKRPPNSSVGEPTREDDSAQPFRPLFRPPVAVLEICDDGAESGELIRVRSESITIGRSNADVVIPHDSRYQELSADLEPACGRRLPVVLNGF